MSVVANGQFLPTESGLTPLLDRLTQAFDARAENEGTLRGLSPAMQATGVPLPASSGGILSHLLGTVGLGSQQSQQQQPMLVARSVPTDSGVSVPSARPGSGSGMMGMFANAISGVESGGKYDAVGVDTGGGDRALGKYQVMASNVGPWTKELLGQELTPQQFLASPQAQDAVFQGKFGQYLQKTGNARDAASMWFTGRPLSQAADAKDALGTTGSGYVQKFMSFLPGAGGGSGDMPRAPAVEALGGAAPMPIASSSPGTRQMPQPGSQPTPQGGLVLPGGMTKESLATMIAEPETRKLGLQIWQQALSPKDDFTLSDGQGRYTHGGALIANRAAAPDYAPQEVNGHVVSFDKRTGRATDATPAGLPQGFRPATPQERAAYNVQADAPLFIGPDGKPMTLNSGQNVTVNTGADPIMGAVGDRFKTSLDQAVAASKAIPAIRTARAQLDQGIISGAGANQILGLQKIASQLGVPGADANRITNTEAFRAAVGPIVLSTVKGLGAGAGISNADRDFAERMAGGNIQLDGSSIRRILDIQEKAAGATIAQHNALAAQMQKTPSGAAAYRNVGGGMQVAVPDATAGAPSKTIGGVTYTQGPDGHWYSGAP